eukprot:scaffold1355_cov268-Pinguiococcus_pyrenoidosus.AAC.69
MRGGESFPLWYVWSKERGRERTWKVGRARVAISLRVRWARLGSAAWSPPVTALRLAESGDVQEQRAGLARATSCAGRRKASRDARGKGCRSD